MGHPECNVAHDGHAATSPSPDRIMALGFCFRASKVLLTAVELGLFTELAGAPLDGETLRRRLGLHRRGARDFLDSLVALRMLERRDGLYRNAPETDFFLDRGKPSYVGGLLELANTQIYASWCLLTEALRTGRPRNGIADGEDLFDRIRTEPGATVRFAQAMSGASLPVAWALARWFPWRDFGTFVDVGAAGGTLAVEIARAHPHLGAGGFDLPQVQPIFEAYVEKRGLSGRIRFHSGDFFADPLPPADVLVMGQVLHDWNLAQKRELLANAYAALPDDGVLVVYDQMIDDQRRRNAAGLLMSLSMLVGTQGGFDYTAGECVEWMRDAGFAATRREPLTGPYSMVVGTKRKTAAAFAGSERT